MFKTWISGGIAGVVLWTAIFPADVIKSRQQVSISPRVSVQGVESLWDDCRFIPADWGS